MMKRFEIFFIMVMVFAACDTTGVKKEEGGNKPASDLINGNKQGGESDNSFENNGEVKDEVTLSNGLNIKWYKHGEGAKLADYDMVRIDYKVRLKNGEVIDGNHLLNKPNMLFMIGFGMQTPGWDIALKELKVGDEAEIFIPSKLARGEKEVKGLFPANSDNILKIKIIEKASPTREVDGNRVWVFEENEKNKMKFDEGKQIEFHTMAFTPSNALYINTFRDNNPFKMKLEDYGLVPGLKKSLINAKKADRMYVYVPSEEAYGNKGYLDLVKPNEPILYNILVMDVALDAQ